MSADVRTFGVFLHSTGESGGYVVRSLIDGRAAAPYGDESPVAIRKRESAAQRVADGLNAPRFGEARR